MPFFVNQPFLKIIAKLCQTSCFSLSLGDHFNLEELWPSGLKDGFSVGIAPGKKLGINK